MKFFAPAVATAAALAATVLASIADAKNLRNMETELVPIESPRSLQLELEGFNPLYLPTGTLYEEHELTNEPTGGPTYEGVHGYDGLEGCDCAPATIQFVLNLGSECVNEDLTEKCEIYTSPASIEKPPPEYVSYIGIKVFNQNREVIRETKIGGRHKNGTTFSFSTKPKTQRPKKRRPEFIEFVIHAVASDKITFTIPFTNQCSRKPLVTKGRKIGWIQFMDSSLPDPEVCLSPISSSEENSDSVLPVSDGQRPISTPTRAPDSLSMADESSDYGMFGEIESESVHPAYIACITIIFVAVTFLLVYSYCRVQKRGQQQSDEQTTQSSIVGNLWSPNEPLASKLAKMNTVERMVVYSEAFRRNRNQAKTACSISGAENCVICMEPLNKGDVIVWSITPSCQHVYHKTCMVEYLANRKHTPASIQKDENPCPTCRQPFVSVLKKNDKKKNCESSGQDGDTISLAADHEQYIQELR